MKFEVESVNIDIQGHMSKVQGEKFWTYAASEWHKLYRPYVPFQNGALYNTVNITGGGGNGIIEHTVPYAHYAYEGRVMAGPAPKHYTGAMLNFSGMGSAKWDQAARPTMFPLLISDLQRFVDSGALGFTK